MTITQFADTNAEIFKDNRPEFHFKEDIAEILKNNHRKYSRRLKGNHLDFQFMEIIDVLKDIPLVVPDLCRRYFPCSCKLCDDSQLWTVFGKSNFSEILTQKTCELKFFRNRNDCGITVQQRQHSMLWIIRAISFFFFLFLWLWRKKMLRTSGLCILINCSMHYLYPNLKCVEYKVKFKIVLFKLIFEQWILI